MDELQRQLKAFSKRYGFQGQMMKARIEILMKQGKSPEEAIRQVFKEYGVEEWLQANVSSVIVGTAQDALGQEMAKDLPAAALLEALSNPWDGSGLTLSEKIHGASNTMLNDVIATVRKQIHLNKTVKDTAQALYDGYRNGHVVREQQLPKYLDELTRWTRRSRENLSQEELKDLQRAIRKVRYQADDLVDDRSTYNHFRTSLRELMDKLEHGNEKAAQRALQTAIEEKSRYVAERIARTEAARARYDAFLARYGEDDSVVAYQWKLGSRHPAEDICDMYTHADLYGLGAGVFPKDKAPVSPAHPHCLCHYAPVYASELKGKKRSDNVEGRGNAWLKRQPLHIRQAILGVKGEQEWKTGRAGWMEKARNLSDMFGQKESRLANLQAYKKPIYGDAHQEKHYKNDLTLNLRKVKNTSYDLYVSTDLHLKPKMLDEMQKQIAESIKVMRIKNMEHFPRFIIMSDNEAQGAWGNYSAEKNTLYINADSLKRKQYVLSLKQTLEEGRRVSSTSHLSTMVHELFHWMDAENYIAKHGKIINQQSYVEAINNYYKKNVEKLTDSGYNISEISDYAYKAYIMQEYAEVVTEYRVKKILGGT